MLREAQIQVEYLVIREGSVEPSQPGNAVAHAPTPVPRSGYGALPAAVDTAARPEGLLGNGEGAGRVPRSTRDV